MSPVRPPVAVIGYRLDPEHYRVRDFLTRMAVALAHRRLAELERLS